MRGSRHFDDNRSREPQTRINDRIRVREVLLIDDQGENLGVKTIEEAQKFAYDLSLDLVEISPQARPPVCRVMDYGKWKYEQNVKAKQARKGRSQVTIKEIKFRPKIGVADYTTKKNHVIRFLEQEDKVKITIMFRGREVVHSDLGRKILERLAEDVVGFGTVESHPNLEGRNMTMMLAPAKVRKDPAKPDESSNGDDPMKVPESVSESVEKSVAEAVEASAPEPVEETVDASK